MGDTSSALEALSRADAELLLDLAWLDRCPLLESLRGDPRFQAVRESVAARAYDVLAVLDGVDTFTS